MMGIFSSSSINDTLGRDYFLFIGRLSSTHLGTKCLEKTSGVFQQWVYVVFNCQRGYVNSYGLSVEEVGFSLENRCNLPRFS